MTKIFKSTEEIEDVELVVTEEGEFPVFTDEIFDIEIKFAICDLEINSFIKNLYSENERLKKRIKELED